MNYLTVCRALLLALAAWQLIWHLVLPEPMGNRSAWLAGIAFLPLMLPIKGVLALRHRALAWAAYLVLLYLVIGIMEVWSNPDQRLAAWVQTALTATYLGVLFSGSRGRG